MEESYCFLLHFRAFGGVFVFTRYICGTNNTTSTTSSTDGLTAAVLSMLLNSSTTVFTTYHEIFFLTQGSIQVSYFEQKVKLYASLVPHHSGHYWGYKATIAACSIFGTCVKSTLHFCTRLSVNRFCTLMHAKY